MNQPNRSHTADAGPVGTSVAYRSLSTTCKWEPSNRALHRLLNLTDAIALARLRFDARSRFLKDWEDPATIAGSKAIRDEYEEVLRAALEPFTPLVDSGRLKALVDELHGAALAEAVESRRQVGCQLPLEKMREWLFVALDHFNHPITWTKESDDTFWELCHEVGENDPKRLRHADLKQRYDAQMDWLRQYGCDDGIRDAYIQLLSHNMEHVPPKVIERFEKLTQELYQSNGCLPQERVLTLVASTYDDPAQRYRLVGQAMCEPDGCVPQETLLEPVAEAKPILPEPLPDDANPFRVILRTLEAAYYAAYYVMEARLARVEQLGRKMRTEDRNGTLVPHWEDDVSKRPVEVEFYPHLNAWHKAHTDARQLCARFGIPFVEYDSILKATWVKLEDAHRVIQGVADDTEVHLLNDFDHSLCELANSTTSATSSDSMGISNRSSVPIDGEVSQIFFYDEAAVQSDDTGNNEKRCDAFDKLPDSMKDAWRVYEAVKHELDNEPSLTKKITDKSVYKRAKDNGTPLDSYETWSRYIRGVKKVLGISKSKHASNRKQTTRSIVGREHLQTRNLERT